MSSVLLNPHSRGGEMANNVLGPARNVQGPNRAKLVRCVLLVTLVSAFLFLTACSLPNNSSTPNSQSSSPQSLAVSGVLPPAVMGVSYNGTLAVSGGTAPYHFTIASGALPAGLLLSQTTGTISGTPSNTGAFSFSVSATDSSSHTGSHSFQVTVSNSASVVVTVSAATNTVQSAGTDQFTALVRNTSNVGITWKASTGTISSAGLYQAPTVSSSTTATITATSVVDPTKSGKAVVTVTAGSAPPLSISTTSVPSATVGSAYSTSLSATGGKSAYSWSVTSGTLPSGITLQSAGSLSGTPGKSGQFSFSVQVSDSSSPQETASRSFTLTVNGSTGGGGPLSPATLFGFTDTSTQSKNFPTVSYGMQRFWDSPPLQWPSINTASGVFDFTHLDSTLAQGHSSGVMEGMYTLSRTPPWATSNPSDTSCHYTTAVSGGGAGECDAPIDLNTDGSGTNAIWKAWITAIATHVNDATYLQTHSHIRYWEIWNEPDNQPFWSGSFAQLARLTEDANCIITGRGVIHESGNGSATPCTATAIDPTAKIVMSSGHAKTGGALTYAQNQLYCNASPKGYELPCPIPANAIATAVDIINFHMKPGNETGNNCPAPTPCTPESAMQMYVSNIHGMLQPAELAKPLWDGEASYAMNGFTNAYSDQDMAASFMARFYLINWSLNISGMAWYDWNELVAQPASVQTAYQQTYNWLANSSLSTPCAASGTLWSCGITQSGKQYLIMWDTAQSCANGSCTTGNQTVASQWTQYQDMTTASSPITISGHVVPVGVKPVVLH
jgi:hypothetical protein